MNEIGLVTAFGAGILSFVSPCVLPIVPGYLSLISGVTIEQIKEGRREAVRRVFASSLAFVIGFSVVFIALGASASAISSFLREYSHITSKIAGAIIIALGLHFLGLYKIKWLNYEKRFQMSSSRVGLFGSFVIGLAFAFGWTPCIGPILAGILAMAAAEETVTRGVLLLAVYSAGLALPFILTSLAFNVFASVSRVVKRYFRVVEIVGGLLLIGIGFFIFTNSLGLISGLISEWFPWLNLG